LPSGKDGFLATNSLLAFFVILHRSYTATQTNGVGISAIIPPTSSAFLHLKEVCRKLWNRQYFVILCGPSMVSAGIDLESRFTEAAIGATQLADYRNFAHGRHYWLAKHRSETAVVAFVAEEDRDLATRTLALIPSGIPCVGIDIDGPGLAAAVAGVWTSIYLAGLAGVAKGLDPGRPKVPPFGRKLYHLRRTTHRKAATAADWERLLITRKARQSPSALIANNTFGLWEAALRNFRDRMRDGRFKALVCDYDGTLCHQRERFTGISNGLAAELVRCLRGGMRIGIATGRGKSVRGDLRKVIPRALWNRVVVGYYNGSALGRLDGSEDPSHSAQTSPEVQAIVEVLSLNPPLGLKASISVRPFQITLETAHSVEQLWEVVHGIVSRCAPTLQVLRSAHSIDVLDSNASKANVVAEIGRTTEGRMGEILLIGDKGRWPGNDYALLAGKYSLSVDESSLDPETCWHLAPRGYLGPRATLHYLRSLRRSSGGLFRLTEI
jgi:hydroxymethylpyrimidine pyrophosphatase-like HAD family hydrolase